MFVCSVRASTIRFSLLIALMLAVLVTVIAFGTGQSVAVFKDGETYRFTGVKDAEDRVAFLSQFGIEVKDEGVSEESFTMPDALDRVLLGYNEIQKRQGLDLSKYQGKKVTRYTYEVKNGDYEGTTLVNLIVCRGRVVAADVSGRNPDSFVIPLTEFAKTT